MFLDPSLLVRAANTTFNAAAVAGSSQCKDIDHCRTLPSIIFGCFSTVFLCTWTALHSDLPADYSDRIGSLVLRVLWMLGALFAPEMVFMEAFDEWTYSSELFGKILKHYPNCGWTETHAQFMRMGGFRFTDANSKSFLDCVKDGTIDLPEVPKDEILARSKGDLTAKIIAVIQTAWFVIQCIHRRSQNLILTQLEITTLGYTLINFFIYFCWWHKPYEVALPIEVPFKERRPETVRGPDEKVESNEGSLNGNDSIQPEVPQTPEIGENPIQPPSSGSEKGLAVATKSSDDKSPVADADKELKSDAEVEASTHTPSTSPQLSWYTRLGIKAFSVNDPEQLQVYTRGRIVLNTMFFIVGCSFGAMHCLAWNSAFPTRAEQHIWQVSSLIVTVIGGVMVLGMSLVNDNVIVFSVMIYSFARISLFVLALLQLRALPYTAYATPSWTIFYPHIG